MAGATYDSLQQLISQSGGSPFDLSTSIYLKLPYDSPSLLSKSSTWQKFETFLSVCCDVITPSTEDNQENTVENLLSTSTDEGHSGTCIALKTYLENVIVCDELEIKAEIANRFVSESPRQVLSSKTTRPDISCCIKRSEELFTILQFEVLSSGDRKATIKKLAMQLMMQLIGIRRKDSTKQMIAGLYVPTVEHGGRLEKVVCEWSDEAFLFMVSTEFVENVESSICEVFTEQCEISFPVTTDAVVDCVIPLTKMYVSDMFGNGAFQIAAGESFVICNPSERKIYKLPFSERKSIRCVLSGEVATCSVFPEIEMKLVDTHLFSIYKLMLSPISKTIAKKAIKFPQWSYGIVNGIEELHNHRLKIAHLDIRLPNVCYKPDGTPVLIDFDRSCIKAESRTSFHTNCYSESVLYSAPPPQFTVELFQS